MGKDKLGKGIDALLQESSDRYDVRDSGGVQTVHYLDPTLLQANPHQARRTFAQESLEELAASIREHGVIQPVLAEKNQDGSWVIIAGERRTRAAILAGLNRIPVIVRTCDHEKKLAIALIENVQRENLNPLEEARAYQHIMDLGNLSHEELAQRVGKNRSTITNALRLLKLPPEVQQSLSSRTLSAGHARALLSLTDMQLCVSVAQYVVTHALSVRAAEECVACLNRGGSLHDYAGARAHTAASSPSPGGSATDITRLPPSSPSTYAQLDARIRNADIADIEQQLLEQLGTKVRISGNLQRGRIEITYFSQAELERLYGLLKAH
ncbi:ParB/RepB/Spo0J family partition protein [Treponema pallidum]|uniref:ParB/RepB/Spo0J family partition protein n=1 Tax=Treponema pallidum TaxID=160 RepID=UPI0007DCF091|nr:ParB/RepB/Spo0J family partition protein [Treponema pallidum]ANI48085.1 chromosome partitioning protein ParB [Treponema pallidum subsp. pallidum]QCP94610.1 chromosome partitioning protein [Treponema pallidum subsp. pallidum]QCQ00439.1 chromosome partitioning protein [Treponema pallidum subsp. pallidum]QUJ40351.1 ParB/RepB/Spo0J family partition protein [Treponema pallidum]QUL36144.1 ParB/RepB/Spo0J family partition protein [Treponema pallidum]